MDILLGLMAFTGWVFLPRTTMLIYVMVMVQILQGPNFIYIKYISGVCSYHTEHTGGVYVSNDSRG
jgi:hypothetical protein